MKRFIALLALVLATFAGSALAEYRWEHFGADPYAATREEAMKDRAAAFKRAGLPDAVVEKLVKATEKPGERTRIVNGDKFDFQLTKGARVQKDVVVAFKQRPDKMEDAAPAEKWQVTHDGKSYTLFLPEVCNNWSGVVVTATSPSRTAKREISTACPKGFAVFANAFTFESLSPELQQKERELLGVANKRDTKRASDINGYRGEDVSRTLGNSILAEAVVRAPLFDVIEVNLLDPQTLAAKPLGTYRFVDGVAEIPLQSEERQMIVETIWPGYFDIPRSGGLPRNWLLPEEWFNERGGRFCTRQLVEVYKTANRR